MKRFHVHLSVPDLQDSIGFYTQLFGTAPTVRKHDYAKWMLEDPRLNFAISSRTGAPPRLVVLAALAVAALAVAALAVAALAVAALAVAAAGVRPGGGVRGRWWVSPRR